LQKRVLGKTGIEVSRMGLGTVKFGRNQGVKYPGTFQLPSDQEIQRILSLAAELGINLLDTAPAYGVSEERIGKLLPGKRDDWVIATKAGETFCDGESRYDFSPAAITQSIERSLQRLRSDYLDIVLVHSNGEDERIVREENVFATLSALKSQGKIRAFGMSTKTVCGGLLTVDHADVAMVTYHSECREDQEVIRYAQQKQKGIFIKKAFESGHLSRPIAECLQFVLAEQGVTSVIVGTINEEHLKENANFLISALLPNM